jgi:ABC-type dipeptide/oligopeptide/nickel transport system ATPase subunit
VRPASNLARVLSIRNLSKSFSGPRAKTVLRDISLDLAAGDYVAVMGESGIGKSTLLNLIAGLDRPDSGQDGREPCLSGVPRHSQDSRRAHRSCLPDAWNRILEIRIRYQRRRMTLRPFSQVTSASVPSRESREVLHYFQYQHWCRELAVVRG